MKNSKTLPGVPKKYFNSLRDENDEPIYTYNGEYMRYYVRQSVKVGRCVALNQYFTSSNPEEVFNIVPKIKKCEKICEILVKHFENLNKYKKIFKNYYKSRFEEYRDIDKGETAEYNNDKLSKLPMLEN